MNTNESIKVWDPLVRVGHWVLATACLITFVTDRHQLGLHSAAGYVALAVIAVRVPWGLIGTRYARFTSFVRRPSVAMAYLRDVAAFRPARHIGHNPAGGLMIVAILVMLVLTGVSGIAAIAVHDHTGPLGALAAAGAPFWLRALGWCHEGLGNLMIALVVAHLVGVVVASLQHRENLIRSMFTGLKEARDECA